MFQLESMNGSFRTQLLRFASAVFVVLITTFLIKLYRARSFIRGLQKQGLPMPPHHWLLGHIPLSASIIGNLPPYAHGVYIGDQIRQRYPHLDSAFYLDNWPLAAPILVVLKPDMMYQLTQANQIPKDKGIRTFLKPLTGESDLVTLEGDAWKYWRAIFNPGFSASHVSTLVPGMIEEIKIFKSLLRKYAENGQMIYLEEASLNLTIDIIGRVAIFHSQTTYNDMTIALRRQLLWCTTGMNIELLEYINIFRPYVHAYNTYRMNRYLSRELNKRYRSIKGSEINRKDKSVVDLALKAYLAENPSATGIDKSFQDFAMAQIKLFIFAGHDTTSAGAIFTYHLLSQHPEILAKVRAEHTEVLGANIADAEAVIASKPQLLNQLTYTIAVIKESLRIYPTVAALRDGQPDFHLVGDNGLRLPTNGTIVWGDHYAAHHNPAHWPRPEEFLPERWIVPEGHELYPPKNGWRPFERGPRNCIGQEVAMTEIKLMLALTIREFDFKDAYEEYDVMKGNPKGLNVNGQRAYMMRRGGGHPADYYPCKVASAR
ncbi:hypothetical protein SS1G_11247 [Sclerotinia sclerotiorum 1980 UF-70]|uniref:Uncharacterized protein n=2 Tax=Sclerotinia sclerotiorum (strain ATCC 18683 / 1980 / Ss-1) TaxID=665079 RepID=A0A1D9QGA5_SCLS1|nr:hypothetical protein SS1G_11247 [Sclerotinia sclerotiorum 1980 UF-70]APA13955.1 hypothetical protein sscle_12g087250 [Sclerotinia sclerotiorum 1980 UF-70]EDN95370.1 hypothetical protein SS1G_11247 [Sclerotinia sclerotiorum 1980 UF-70]